MISKSGKKKKKRGTKEEKVRRTQSCGVLVSVPYPQLSAAVFSAVRTAASQLVYQTLERGERWFLYPENTVPNFRRGGDLTGGWMTRLRGSSSHSPGFTFKE